VLSPGRRRVETGPSSVFFSRRLFFLSGVCSVFFFSAGPLSPPSRARQQAFFDSFGPADGFFFFSCALGLGSFPPLRAGWAEEAFSFFSSAPFVDERFPQPIKGEIPKERGARLPPRFPPRHPSTIRLFRGTKRSLFEPAGGFCGVLLIELRFPRSGDASFSLADYPP